MAISDRQSLTAKADYYPTSGPMVSPLVSSNNILRLAREIVQNHSLHYRQALLPVHQGVITHWE